MTDFCVNVGGNTGKINCDPLLGALEYPMPTNGREFTAEELADPETLADAITEALGLSKDDAGRIFAFPKSKTITPNTGDPAAQTFEDGSEQYPVDPVPKYTILTEARLCEVQSIGRFNGWNKPAYVIMKGYLAYVKKDDGGGRGFGVGNLYVDAPRFYGYAELRAATSRWSFANVDDFRKMGLAKLPDGFDPTSAIQIVDVNLHSAADAAGYVFTVGGKSFCTEQNIFAAYSTLLADPLAWVAEPAEGGAAYTISSVTADATNQGWDITLGNSPTIATGAKVRFKLVDPVALRALDIMGIESNSVIIAKAA